MRLTLCSVLHLPSEFTQVSIVSHAESEVTSLEVCSSEDGSESLNGAIYGDNSPHHPIMQTCDSDLVLGMLSLPF